MSKIKNYDEKVLMSMSKQQLFSLVVDLSDTCEMLNDEISEHKKRFKQLKKQHIAAICKISAIECNSAPKLMFDEFRSQIDAYKTRCFTEQKKAELATSKLNKVHETLDAIIDDIDDLKTLTNGVNEMEK